MEPETQELPVKRVPGRPKKEVEDWSMNDKAIEAGHVRDPQDAPPASGVNVSLEQFQMMMTFIAQELRKPVVDPIKEQQRQRMKEHNKVMRKDALEVLLNRFRGCNHMQLPGGAYTGCCCVAWGTQSDGKVRGVCQHCNTLFSPVREECLHQEIWEMYQHLRRLPTHPSGNVSYTFQQA